ncbi:MAG: Lrp/AsnC family transcriptional regulator [Candidatus Micrarchaeota archaeon]
MALSIDAKDSLIIYSLDLDARQPVSKLSKKVKLNRRVVCYRIERMVEEGIIQKFLLFLNLPKFGYTVTSFYARFRSTQPTDEEAVINYLKGKKQVMWLASMEGRFHLGFTLCTKNTSEVAEFLDAFRDLYGKLLSDTQSSYTVFAWRFPRKYLMEKDNSDHAPQKELPVEREELDNVDRKILAALGEDGRMRAVEIARRAGVSADAVADRISKLRHRKIIASVGVLIDNVLLNRRLFRTFIMFQNLNAVKDRFMRYCSEHPNAIQVKRTLGSWEWEVDLEVKDETELRKIHSEFKEHFKDEVGSTSFVTIYKVHKFDLGGFLLK